MQATMYGWFSCGCRMLSSGMMPLEMRWSSLVQPNFFRRSNTFRVGHWTWLQWLKHQSLQILSINWLGNFHPPIPRE